MIPKSMFHRGVFRHLAPIASMLDDPEISELMINGPFEVWVERAGKLEFCEAKFEDHEALMAAMRHVSQYLGQTLSDSWPILEGRLPDGSRIEAIFPPIVENGAHVSIRRFPKSALTLDRLVQLGAIDSATLVFLADCFKAKKNMLVVGGTGSGKTSLLNALMGLCSESERLVVIEDARELQPQVRHSVRMESQPPDQDGKGEVTVRDLLKATLRMRPDRIVLGEIRSGEAIDLLQAMSSGHGGSMSTLHASSPRQALSRLETMAQMADLDLPLAALRAQIGMAVDLIVQTARLRCGGRALTSVTEVRWDEGKGYRLTDLVTRRHASEGEGALKDSTLVLRDTRSHLSEERAS